MFEIFNDEDFFSKLEIVRNTCCLISSNSSNNFFDSDKLIKHIVIDALKEKLKDLIINGIDNFIDLGAPLAYLGDPRIATAETGEKVYDIFSDIVTDEAEELVKK